MKRFIIAGLIILTTIAATAAPFSADRVAAGAKWVAYADFDTARDTKSGEFVMGELTEGKAAERFEAFKAIFNFDPRKDIHSLTVYGTDMRGDDGIMLVDADFDKERLITLAQANDTYTKTMFGNVEIHSWIDNHHHHRCGRVNERAFSCFASDGTMILGDSSELVINALNVIEGSQPSLESGSLLDLSEQTGSPFFVAALDVPENGDIPAHAAIIRQSKNVIFSVKEEDDQLRGTLVLNTDDEETALRVDAIVKGMWAMALLHEQDCPRLTELTQNLQVETKDSQVKVEVACSVDKMIEMLKAAVQEHINTKGKWNNI